MQDKAEYDILCQVLRRIFDFVRVNVSSVLILFKKRANQPQMAEHFPVESGQFQLYCDVLPFAEASPAYPNGGFVINIRCCTLGHRDHVDLEWCVSINLGDYEGGEMCLHEAGLVLESRPGDVSIFRSRRQTHFNLHYTGVRISVILHTDLHATQMIEGSNGWGGSLAV